MKNFHISAAEIQGTFFEEVLNSPEIPIEQSVNPDDKRIGKATSLELRFFYFYLVNANPAKYKLDVKRYSDTIRCDMRAHTALGFLRSLIADRLKVGNEKIHRIWIRAEGEIIIADDIMQ